MFSLYDFCRTCGNISYFLFGGGSIVTLPTSETSTEFRLSYCGDATIDNTMDVRDLAPSLIALGELFDRANNVLNGKDFGVSLKIKATNAGSFELYLLLTQIGYTATQILSSQMITSAANLVGLVTGVPKIGESLFSTIKKLRGEKPTEIRENEGIIFKATNVELHVSEEVVRLYKDDTVKELSRAVVSPLLRKGIDRMVVKDGQKELETVNKDDTQSFNISEIINTIPDNIDGKESIFEGMRLKIISPTFDDKKW